jgi:diguanylate cyclase (GGDEF)-like protein
MERAPVDMSVLARSFEAQLRIDEPTREVRFEITDGVSVTGDARLLKLVIDNLLGNAAKFSRTSPSACIQFGVTRERELSIYHFGDTLLRELGPRFDEVLRKSDTVVRLPSVERMGVAVARLGGDEFAVLLSATPQLGAMLAAERVLKVFERPFSIQGQSLDVGASVGIALYPEHGRDAEILLQHADVAMYDAKAGKSGYTMPALGPHSNTARLDALEEEPAHQFPLTSYHSHRERQGPCARP